MDLRALGMGLAFVLIWSSAFSSARIIVADAPPLAALTLRFLVSGVLGVGIARAMGQSWRLTRSQWRAVLIFGFSQNALYLGLNFYAMQTVEASIAAIIASTMPLLVALGGWVILRERLSGWAYVGLIAGMVGVAIIMGGRISAGIDLFALGLLGIGSLALAVATLAVRGVLGSGNLLMVVGLQMFVGAVPLALASAALETYSVNFSWQLVAAFTYTTLVSGLIATWVWFALVGRIGAVRAATFHFLNPFFGVAIAAVLLGETMSIYDLVGVAIVTAGILAVQLSRRRSP
jgi:probable blue pigment (indigoidine) exporter